MSRPTFIDLFSGAGLFSAGMIRAGFKPILALELASQAVASYKRNVSGCIELGSVSEYRSAPRADVVIAGPPCQGFSTLGRRDPLDLRNELSLAVLPWVRKVRPQVVIIENVPPFTASAQWAHLKSGLQELGFTVSVWELEAAQFGTPQCRRRAFTIASRRGSIDAPRPRRKIVAAGDVLFDSMRPLQSDDPMHIWPTAKGVAADRIKLVPLNGDKRDIMARAPDLCPPSWFKMGCQATDAWGRMDATEPANTIRCTFQNPSKGRYLHPTENRVLSLREGARLQDVPDAWIFDGRPLTIARQIGNGVPISLAAAVGKRIAANLC